MKDKIPKCTLVETLTFESDPIIDRFMGTYDVTDREAETFFCETKKWLWLCARAYDDRRKGRIEFRLIIDEYLVFIDEMWHNFILFTRIYQKFCEDFLGTFIHHNPTPPKERKVQLNDVRTSTAAYDALIDVRREQYNYVYDNLGSETLQLWYGDYGLAYRKSWFHQRQRFAEQDMMRRQ